MTRSWMRSLAGWSPPHPPHHVPGTIRALSCVRIAGVGSKVATAPGRALGQLWLSMGYVARGLADRAVNRQCARRRPLTRRSRSMARIDGGRPVLYLFGNHGGEVMNFGLSASGGRNRRG